MSTGDYVAEEQAYRDASAAGYDATFSAYQLGCEGDDLRRLIAEDAGVLLDIGCGTHRFGEILSERARHLIGADISIRSLEIARAKEFPNSYYAQSTSTALPIRDSSIDTALSIQVLEHLLEEKDARLMMEEVRRVLSPTGRAVITVYNYHLLDRLRRQRSGRSPSHRFRRYTTQELDGLVRDTFGPATGVTVRGQCFFLRRGTVWLRRLFRDEDALASSRLFRSLASFLVIVIEPGNLATGASPS